MKKKILIIEDDKDIAELLEFIINGLDFQAILSKDIINIDAVLALQPDLIILDHILEYGLGGKLCLQLKVLKESKHIPVLMVSATRKLADLVKECHADDYIKKPFAIPELQQKIFKLLML